MRDQQYERIIGQDLGAMTDFVTNPMKIGEIEDGITWVLKDGSLTISGTGAMTDIWAIHHF